jgi:CRISPR-associated protein (TIGR02710 family)
MTPTADLILLIITVGGTSEPVVRSILELAPTRIAFLHSFDSKPIVSTVCDELDSYERPLSPGSFDLHLLTDPQSFTDCVHDIRRLSPVVQQWTSRGDHYTTVADITGGTKAMSAALALVAHRWPNTRFSYIGGDQRDKHGLGAVTAGHERHVLQVNPWHALAYQPLQDAVQLFNHRRFTAVQNILDPLTKSSRLPDPIKSQLRAVLHLADAYQLWDAFRHADAHAELKNALKRLNDLDAALPDHQLRPTLRAHLDLTNNLANASQGRAPTPELINDLLANAQRRALNGQYDDATARLYRATEAIAQHALQNRHCIDPSRCPLAQVPLPLKSRWQGRADDDGTLKLALQDDYALLLALNDPVGCRFHELQLHERNSPLTTRNQSILAHGLTPTTEKACDILKTRIHQLAGNPDLTPFNFPSLPNP